MFESNGIKNNVTLVLIQLATIGILHNINFKANILFTKITSRSFSRRGKPKKDPPPSIKTEKASNIEKNSKKAPPWLTMWQKNPHGEKSSKKAPHIAKHISFFIF